MTPETCTPAGEVEALDDMLDRVASEVRQALMDVAHEARGLKGRASSVFISTETMTSAIILSFKSGGSRAALRSGASGAVKALEWYRVSYGWLAFEEWYRIEDQGSNWPTERYWLYERGERLGKFDAFEQADVAMFKLHEARILSALTAAQPASPDVEGEPVAWARMTGDEVTHLTHEKRPGYKALYLAPPSAETALASEKQAREKAEAEREVLRLSMLR